MSKKRNFGMSKNLRNMKGLELFDYVSKNKEYISECCYLTECMSIDKTKRYATVLVSLDLDKLEDDKDEIDFLTDRQKHILIKRFQTYMQKNIPFRGSGDAIIAMKRFIEEL